MKIGTFLTAPESQQPAYISGEFHERNHPALSSRISTKKHSNKGLGQCEHVCNIGTIDDIESAGIFGGLVHFLSVKRRRWVHPEQRLKGTGHRDRLSNGSDLITARDYQKNNNMCSLLLIKNNNKISNYFSHTQETKSY